MSLFNIHESLIYTQPENVQLGEIQFVKFTPPSQGPFGQGETISVKLQSNTEFLDTKRSYMRFNLTCDTTTTFGNLHQAGGTMVFKDVSDSISGLSLPTERNWFIRRACVLNTDSAERQGITSYAEKFTTNSAGSLTTNGTVIPIVCPLITTVETDQLLPLASFNAGHTISYTLNQNSNILVSGGYTVSNLEIIACLIQPSQDYLRELDSGMANGKNLNIPLVIYKHIPFAVSSATSQTLPLQVGYLSSINSITCVPRESNFQNSTKIQDIYYEIDSVRYPRNRAITNGPDSFYATISSMNSQLSSLSTPMASQAFQHYSWKSNSSFNSGQPSSNGTVVLNVNFSSAPSNMTIESIIASDALLVISKNSANLLQAF